MTSAADRNNPAHHSRPAAVSPSPRAGHRGTDVAAVVDIVADIASGSLPVLTAPIDYHELLGAVHAVVWRADPATFMTTFATPEAEQITGYPADQWLHAPGFWVEHVHPDDREAVIALTTAAIRECRTHDFEYRMVGPDGREIWLRNVVTVRCQDGRPLELVGATIDIGDRKRAEFESAQLRHELMRVARAAVLGEVSGAIAHELNQPLGAIVSGAESALLLGSGSPGSPQLAEVLDDLRQQAVRAGDILHMLMSMLRHQPLRIAPVDLPSIVDGVVTLIRSLAAARHIDLVVDVPDDLPPLAGDTVQLQQLLLNLITNAIDAIGSADSLDGLVRITARRDGDAVAVSVIDSGPGIAPDVLARLFEPFVTTKEGGSGIGLSICHRIAEAHGGRIWAANNAAGGATFTFTLPVARGVR